MKPAGRNVLPAGFISVYVDIPCFSAGDMDGNIAEFRSTAIREDTDMCAVRGMRDSGTQRFHIVYIKNHDLVFAHQCDMMDTVF